MCTIFGGMRRIRPKNLHKSEVTVHLEAPR